MWIDTDCHLDAAEFAVDRDAVAAAARAAGVNTIVVPAVEVANFRAVQDCCQRYAGCVAAYGIHPMYTPQADAGDLEVLRNWLARERPVAVGEIGLDHFVPGLDRERQRDFFVAQLKLAREFDLPVLLHVRRAVDEILRELRRCKVRGGIAHAFNGSRQQADILAAMGFKLGFGGATTYERATRLRALAAELPLGTMVMETDAPDMPLNGFQGQPNRPEQAARVFATLCELRKETEEAIASALLENTRSVFGITL